MWKVRCKDMTLWFVLLLNSSAECLISSKYKEKMASMSNSSVSRQKRRVYIGTIGWPLVLRKVLLLLKPRTDNHILHWHKLELNNLKCDKRQKRNFLKNNLEKNITVVRFSDTLFFFLSEVSELTSHERQTNEPSFISIFLAWKSFHFFPAAKLLLGNLTSYECWSIIGTFFVS